MAPFLCVQSDHIFAPPRFVSPDQERKYSHAEGASWMLAEEFTDPIEQGSGAHKIALAM
jgi:hypothetical protein